MRWDDNARAAVAKAPVFVRGMVTRRVEEHVRGLGREVVTLADVEQLRASRTAGGMSADQIEKIVRDSRPQLFADERTYEIKTCFPGCPRSLYDVNRVADKMVGVIEAGGVPEAVVRRANGPILRHHRLSVSISGCPNSCSQPQIADFGVQGRAAPMLGDGRCNCCGACVDVCTEGAVTVSYSGPALDPSRCIDCGDCASACPTQALVIGESGFSVLIGGKLGRHPQLARTLFDFTDEKTLLTALQVACEVFASDMQPRERLADAVSRIGVEEIARRCVCRE